MNPDLIEFLEATPDTAILLRGGKRIVVREPMDQVVQSIMAYKKYVHSNITVRKPADEG